MSPISSAYPTPSPTPIKTVSPAVVGSLLLFAVLATVFLALVVQAALFFSLSPARPSTATGTGANPTDAALGLVVGAGGESAETATAAQSAAATRPRQPVTAAEIVSVDGIRVHTSISANLEALLAHAERDGITLAGWGWRDSATQIRLRRKHCGTTDYAIYRQPSSTCSPPTARPGRSQHEFGLAVDFTYNGGSISTRRSPGFRWLNQHAGSYGFKNLPSEPWHWSTTGR